MRPVLPSRHTVFIGVCVLLPAAMLQAQVCDTNDKGARLCINQPQPGTTLSGWYQLVGGAVPSDAHLTVKVNDSAATPAPVEDPANSGKFAQNNLGKPLAACDEIEVDQSNPAAKATATVPGACETSSLFTLGLAGINATGSSSSGPSQQYFLEYNLLSPVPGHKICPFPSKPSRTLEQKCWVWLNPRIASVPSQNSATISSLTSTSALTSGIGSQSLSQITQSFEFQTGFEYYLLKPWNGRQFGWKQSWSRTSASVIVGGGSVTPFSGATGAAEFGLNPNLAQQFLTSPTLTTEYPQLASALLCAYPASGTAPSNCPKTTPTTVAFLFPNRSRFYRDFFGGFRLRTFYFKGDCGANRDSPTCKLTNTYPGTFDLRFGEDETVTAGKFLPFVVTLTGSYPLPVPGAGGTIRIFGSAYLRTVTNRNTQALALVPAASFTSIDNPTVVIQSIQPIDTDYYRLGVGVDLVSLFGKLGGSK